mgnify:CR=1 FL=1
MAEDTKILWDQKISKEDQHRRSIKNLEATEIDYWRRPGEGYGLENNIEKVYNQHGPTGPIHVLYVYY